MLTKGIEIKNGRFISKDTLAQYNIIKKKIEKLEKKLGELYNQGKKGSPEYKKVEEELERWESKTWDSKTKDDVNINISISGEGVKVSQKGKGAVQSPEGNAMKVDPGTTEGILYHGYSLKPLPDGTCEIFSTGGARIGSSKTVYLAMGRVDKIIAGGS